jgi:cytochrome c-type biogenesis protein CcmF
MQEKKGMMKVWNMVLVSSTFFLCIFGTFLTRSGVVQSVHAFSEGPIGKYFVGFLAIGITLTVYLILSRLEYLKSESQMESVLSRESSFMFNNLILLAGCFAVLWGTLFPVITEAIMGEKISVDKPFFNRVNIPIGMFLLLLTGVGPLIAWRRSSFESLKRAFLWPAVSGLFVSAVLFALGIRSFYALMSFGLCAFVLVTVAIVFELTHRNTRRYGGYLVHVGIVILFVGFTGAAFNQDTTVELPQGGTMNIGAYTLKVVGYEEGQNANYSWGRPKIAVTKNGEELPMMMPEQRFYFASQTPTHDIALRRRLNEDLYINYAGPGTGNNNVILQVYVNPLVSWVWIGYWVVLFGTIICLIPSKTKLVFPRTEVVGIAGKQVGKRAQNIQS